MLYGIEELAKITGAVPVNLMPYGISNLSVDSRRLSFPAETLFFAIKTDANDGHKYIKDAYDAGVRCFVVSALPEDTGVMPQAVFLKVLDVLSALQAVASYHRKRFGIPVIGITGSNGKSVVKEFLYHLLSGRYNIVRSPKSYNSQIGVPLSVWNMDHTHEMAVFEAGISKPGEMSRLEKIIRPDIGVLTNIGAAHQENFRSYKEKALEKLKLFSSSGCIVYCADDPVVVEAVGEASLPACKVVWSRYRADADVFVGNITVSEDSTSITAICGGVERRFTIPFTDDASIENVIHCICVIYCIDPGLLADTGAFSSLEPVAMRLEVKQGRNASVIINDTYNSDINSLAIALDFLSARKRSRGTRSVLILSDILQSGMSPQALYGKVAEIVKEKGVDRLICIGGELYSQKGFFSSMESSFYLTTEDFLASMHDSDFSGETVLVKGSRNFHFEKITERLELRLHETVMEVDLDAIVHNFNYFRSLLKPETRMVCMVKASAYGAGAVEVSRTLQEHHCDALAVAVADEGVELRHEGITLPILVMNPEMNSLNLLFEYGLEPEIYSFRLLEAFIQAGRLRGETSFPFHIKIDTGMHRLGFVPEDIPEICAMINAQNSVLPKSVFSHLAGSDSPDLDDFTMSQISCFTESASALERGLGRKLLKHILNSAGIERFAGYQMDMVRLGVGLYGIGTCNPKALKNVCTLKTVILQIRKVPAGDSIGYGRKTFVDRDSLIAVIPIGYADGLDRHFGNRRGHVLINGKPAPIVGNICMDACMVDVTGINAQEGDTVVVFGDGLSVSELAGTIGTIPYEILTSPSSRVQRVYFRE